MYRCEDCGRFFEEPVVVHDDPSASGVSLPSGYYTEWYCPHCGSDKVEEAGKCQSCGEPVEKGKVLCDNCSLDLLIELRELADMMDITTDDLMCAIEEL